MENTETTTEKEFAPHQQRVVDEKNELEDRFKKLDSFILDNPIFTSLPQEEQDLLTEQKSLMERYLAVLIKRIERF